jgi:hypothetical protein
MPLHTSRDGIHHACTNSMASVGALRSTAGSFMLETFEEQWQDGVIRGPCLQAVSSAENEALVT